MMPQGRIGSFRSLTTALADRMVFLRKQKPGWARVSSRRLRISSGRSVKLRPATKERPYRSLAPRFRAAWRIKAPTHVAAFAFTRLLECLSATTRAFLTRHHHAALDALRVRAIRKCPPRVRQWSLN